MTDSGARVTYSRDDEVLRLDELFDADDSSSPVLPNPDWPAVGLSSALRLTPYSKLSAERDCV